ncbi:uncharacterized protein N7500_002200 [Penicillium coprophilum]|uniref:uncharacterized protein n=1 Tax=Penicillium coprophilum TaxID=36646 RepID=UPI00239D17AC|nr:uncharacterized protein N7500_002200 [Penicillium coprophilum]KAJ5169417.1 hypothetical protein N7500_002200 [Penicillium coprophilum]
MFTIRCILISVKFGTHIIQPIQLCMHNGRAPRETLILENQLRKIALYGVFDTLQKLTATTMALLFATANPIILSGLFTAKSIGPVSSVD